MSSQSLKQLKIKTSTLRRLRKEFESYQKETTTIQLKIQHLQSELQAINKDEQLEIHIRKNKQFLNESQSVLSNVKQKLIESFEGLAAFLNEKGSDYSIAGTEEKNLAQNMVLDVQTFLQNLD